MRSTGADEGNKSVVYELYEQMDVVPEWIVVPVGSGPLLYGVWKGFGELRKFGLVDRIPRLLAVQPEGCAPIARAFAGIVVCLLTGQDLKYQGSKNASELKAVGDEVALVCAIENDLGKDA